MITQLAKISLQNVKAKKTRSVLTVLGVLIGIYLIVLLFSLSQGLKEAVTEQFAILGPDLITIEPGAGSLGGPAALFGGTARLTEKDVQTVKKVAGIKEVAGFNFKITQTDFKGKKSFLAIHGVDQDTQIMKDIFRIKKGRLVKEGQEAVIGIDLTNKENNDLKIEMKIGDKITIQNRKFRIVGILKKIGNKPDDTSISIPLKTHQEIFGDKFFQIYAKASAGRDINTVQKNIEQKLRRSRNVKEGEEDFTISTAEDILQTFLDILSIVQIAIIGFGTISIFVGFVGIMNSMFTNVLERTREIGIMKATGARNRYILGLFTIESGIYGLLGGTIGITLALITAKGVELLLLSIGVTLIKTHISGKLIIGALTFSLITGIIAGLLPAYRATKLKPVDALRYE